MGAPAVHHTATYEDDRRARELFHYFQPDNPALLPSGHDRAKSKDPSSKASPNLVLTALVQLAAMKLGVQRAIISLIDRETLYVVAEASKSLNLGNNDLYEDDGDGLWMGCSHGPVAGTLCEKTVTLKPTPEARYPLFVVNDLQQHPVYNNIPCVCGPPYFRYYAGTPLTTANGITIGSLYVIDPRPDITLTPTHIETLGSIADAVMDYLETSRQSLESHRLAKVLSGLNSFVQGDDGDDSQMMTFKNVSPSDRTSSRMSSPVESPNQDAHKLDIQVTSDTSSLRSSSPEQDSDNPGNISSENDFPNPSRSPKSAHSEFGDPPPAKHRSEKTHSTFQRAADLMRESLDLGQDGGIVIFDSSELSEVDSQDDLDRKRQRKSASVCALSALNSGSEEPSAASDLPISPRMDLHFVRRMLRRYPRGGLWYFYQDGTASSDDDVVGTGNEINVPSSTTRSQDFVHSRSLGILREKDLQTLRKYFPRATRIVFAPLWDSFNSRWFGGCFGWSAVETRVFSAHVELGGIFGFGSSLMVEYSRAQSQESDRKKGDFISSISHELRSPLHGILAATDFLAEHVDSEFAKSLLDTVRACGQTLLDTFEQILDFTKINSFDMKRQLQSSRQRSDRGRNEKSRSQPRALKVVHVAAVVEDVIESVYSGHIFQNNLAAGVWRLDPGDNQDGVSTSDTANPIDILVDVAPCDWEFLIEPGALRRIVMNVFGNALKYTREGSVTVRIDLRKQSDGPDSTSLSNSPGSEVLFLTVSDTGKGISNEYLQTNIFTPFCQEDSLSPGTGLGLSLVRSIVRSLNGTIKIKSQIGQGTVVKVMLPLVRPQHRDTPSLPSFSSNFHLRGSTDVVERLKKQMKWKTLSLLPHRDAEVHDHSSLHIIRDYLTEWFGLELQSWDSEVRSDLILVNEKDLKTLPKTLDHSVVLVLCQRGPGLGSIKAGALGLSARLIQLTLPCGPYRLARILMEAIETGNRDTGPTLKELSQNLSQVLQSKSLQQASVSLVATNRVTHKSHAGKSVLSETDSMISAVISGPVEGPQSSDCIVKDIMTKDTPKKGIRILLVEDNPINMALLKKFVNRKSPRILHTAVNGKVAVDQVRRTTEGYDYIFMDMSMPVMDGFEATQAIRSIERNRGTTQPATIIALTGLGSSEHMAKAYAVGINVFVTKPFSFHDIERLMDERNKTTK